MFIVVSKFGTVISICLEITNQPNMNTIILKSKEADNRTFTDGQFFKGSNGSIYLLAKTGLDYKHDLICIMSDGANRCDDNMPSKPFYSLAELSGYAADVITPCDVTITTN